MNRASIASAIEFRKWPPRRPQYFEQRFRRRLMDISKSVRSDAEHESRRANTAILWLKYECADGRPNGEVALFFSRAYSE